MPNSNIIVHAESSILGWGIADGKNPSGGRWKADELNDINVLELKGILIRVVAYCKDKAYEHVRIMSDNTTAISYVNDKGVGVGGRVISGLCNGITKELCLWCTFQKLWMSAAHISETKKT